MGYRPQRSQRSLPIRGCDHVYHMVYLEDRCWCDECGQTWKMLGPEKGWYSLGLHEASRGERVSSRGDDWS